MKLSGSCKAKDLIKAITEAWNEQNIGQVWTLDETDTEIIGRN
jgi:hypothetical protein